MKVATALRLAGAAALVAPLGCGGATAPADDSTFEVANNCTKRTPPTVSDAGDGTWHVMIWYYAPGPSGATCQAGSCIVSKSAHPTSDEAIAACKSTLGA